MKKILISDSVDEKCTEILKSAGLSVDYKIDFSKDELLKIIPDYNALIVRSSTQVDAELIEKMQSMEVIGRAGAGVDNIDVKAATRKGILVMNTPGGNTISAAEHTIALMLAASRKIPQANISLHLKKWDRKRFQGSELFGKTLGLIGLGKIGKEVAIRAKAFGMKVISFDPLVSADAGDGGSAGDAGWSSAATVRGPGAVDPAARAGQAGPCPVCVLADRQRLDEC